MIYGIGAQALGEQLAVSVDEASVFMESFKAKFTGSWLQLVWSEDLFHCVVCTVWLLALSMMNCLDYAYLPHSFLSAIGPLPPLSRSHLEQSASTRHVHTLYACFPRTLQGFSLQAFLSMTRYLNFCTACAVTVVIFGHLNRSLSLRRR